MRHSSRRLDNVGQVRWVAIALTVWAFGFAGCGGDSGSEGATGASSTVAGDAGASGEAIVIKTRVSIPTGVILEGSSIGDSAFCSGGSFHDEEGDSAWLMYRALRCPDGTLRIGITTGTGTNRKQAGTWAIISGTGALEGLMGSGQMEIEVEPDSNSEGHETFTGTVTRPS